MQCIPVRLNRSSYDILVGTGVSDDLEKHLSRAGLCEPFLVISQPRILKAVGKSLKKRFPVVSIPDGERAKSLTTVSRLLDRMVQLKLTRQSTVIAFGGGVVGDVAGFVASIYMRGIPVVQIPTTLLAQVDSSIGGKTGVIRDRVLFEDFERNTLLTERHPEAIGRLVARCAAIKADVVMSDEKESDLRRILNFGHTVGHGLEAAAGYQRIKHGEAVGYGMIAAARIGRTLEKIAD